MARREHHYNRGNVSSEVYEVLYYSLLNTGSAERILVIGGSVTQLYQVARYYCLHGRVIKIDKPVPDVLREQSGITRDNQRAYWANAFARVNWCNCPGVTLVSLTPHGTLTAIALRPSIIPYFFSPLSHVYGDTVAFNRVSHVDVLSITLTYTYNLYRRSN